LADALGPTIEQSVQKHVSAALDEKLKSSWSLNSNLPFLATPGGVGMETGHEDVIVLKKDTFEALMSGLESLSASQLVTLLTKLDVEPAESECTEKDALLALLRGKFSSPPPDHCFQNQGQDTTSSIELAEGSEVVIQGLSKVAYNGMVGRCQSFDESKERWQVKLQGGEKISVKPENLVPKGSIETWDDFSNALRTSENSTGESSCKLKRSNSFSEEVEKADLVLVEKRDRQGTVVDVDIESRSCTVRLEDGIEVDTLWSGVIKLGRKDPDELQRQPKVGARKNEESFPKCPICQRAVDAGDIRKLNCKCDTWLHAQPCLRQFLEQDEPVCPTCREPQPRARSQAQSSSAGADLDARENDDPSDAYEEVDPRDYFCQYGPWPHLIYGPCPHMPNGPPPTPNHLRPGEQCPFGPPHHPPCQHYPDYDGSGYRRPDRHRENRSSQSPMEEMRDLIGSMLGLGPRLRVRGFH